MRRRPDQVDEYAGAVIHSSSWRFVPATGGGPRRRRRPPGRPGDGAGITYWGTLADLNAAEQVGQQARAQSSEATEAEVIDVHRFELVLVNRALDPTAPLFRRVNQLYADPDRIDASIASCVTR
jgi:hypothetical protein